MALVEPRPKKNCNLKPSSPLPIIRDKSGKILKFMGVFNGFSVIIEDEEAMQNLIMRGYYGKANLSRSYPSFKRPQTEILRKRVFENRKKWGRAKKPEKVLVIPDSDDEDYFMNLKPQYEIDRSGLKENVHLTLEEAFFLLSAIGCLEISHGKQLLSAEETWKLFKENDKNFMQNYIVYYYFRTRNWVVKPGIKFGGDFLLYKQGPPFYHASYVVVIHVLDEEMKQIEEFKRRSMNMVHLLGLNRLCGTAAKELLICEVILPRDREINFNDLTQVKIRELLLKRWVLSQENKAAST